MGASPETSATPPPLCCEHHGDQKQPEKDHIHLKLPFLKQIKQKPLHCVAIFYILFALVLLIVALAELVLSVNNTALIKSFHTEASDGVIGTAILAICAAIAVLAVIYAIFSICKKNCKVLIVVSIILGILALVQILLVAFAVTVKKDDIRSLEASLTESFLKASKDQDEASFKLWDSMQSTLKCCGLHGPEDYRNPEMPYLPTKVPYTCCAAYQKNETDYYNKWQRDLCILNKSYHSEGCVKNVVSALKDTTKVIVGLSILLIVLEIIVFGIGWYLGNMCSKKQKKDLELPTTSPEVQPKI